MTLELRGRHDALDAEDRARIRQAWWGEVFARQKKLDRFDKYVKSDGPRPTQTPEQMKAVTQRWQRLMAPKAAA